MGSGPSSRRRYTFLNPPGHLRTSPTAAASRLVASLLGAVCSRGYVWPPRRGLEWLRRTCTGASAVVYGGFAGRVRVLRRSCTGASAVVYGCFAGRVRGLRRSCTGASPVGYGCFGGRVRGASPVGYGCFGGRVRRLWRTCVGALAVVYGGFGGRLWGLWRTFAGALADVCGGFGGRLRVLRRSCAGASADVCGGFGGRVRGLRRTCAGASLGWPPPVRGLRFLGAASGRLAPWGDGSRGRRGRNLGQRSWHPGVWGLCAGARVPVEGGDLWCVADRAGVASGARPQSQRCGGGLAAQLARGVRDQTCFTTRRPRAGMSICKQEFVGRSPNSKVALGCLGSSLRRLTGGGSTITASGRCSRASMGATSSTMSASGYWGCSREVPTSTWCSRRSRVASCTPRNLSRASTRRPRSSSTWRCRARSCAGPGSRWRRRFR
ncbi:hypothetical protein DB30_03777 [Enhygromyxa salina]|uniref:Uncharacterized protein n=1 Tax=Enhygromyxa salina TaxID=215803 RepID=A0A0C2D698_9BACT|nr:hypothetical protein DB30_03777 [Enhygromyxa salina]